MVSNMFDDESHFKTLASLKIIKDVLDEQLYKEIKELIENYYKKKNKTNKNSKSQISSPKPSYR